MNWEQSLQGFLSEQQLPPAYLEQARKVFVPVAEILSKKIKVRDKGRPFVLSINGSQGSGKTTLVELLRVLFEHEGLSVVSFSLDDFYLPKAERKHLASTVHPLLATRGVPGTHDIALLNQVLNDLLSGQGAVIPRFDKSIDDRAAPDSFTKITDPVDLIMIEGWCWGAEPQAVFELKTPVNALEKNEDSEGIWRDYSNQALAKDFAPLYELIDCWLMLKAPSFDCVYQWRLEQEQKLAQRSEAGEASGIMDAEQIQRFVRHFQRITENLLQTLPGKADLVWHLDASRTVTEVSGPMAEKSPLSQTDNGG